MNPFQKRATEYIREDIAFLPFVSSEPLLTFFEPVADDDALYDRLVTVIGTPGSGKTTMSRLFLFPTLMTLIATASDSYRPLIDALNRCKALSGGTIPLVAGCRIPLESHFRDFSELPYDQDFNFQLMYCFLQARAMLAWLRGFEQAGIALEDVTMVARMDAEASLDAIGGTEATSLREHARNMESMLYRIVTDLVPPKRDAIPVTSIGAYQPFDVVERFSLAVSSGERTELTPLVVIDDAHELHPLQFAALNKRLRRREIRTARWIMTRFDALQPSETLADRPDSTGVGSGMDPNRDSRIIWMQTNKDRGTTRKAFRRSAKDMAARYIAQMPVFARRRLTILADMLLETPITISSSKLVKVKETVDTTQRRLKIHDVRRADIEKLVENYAASKGGIGPDVALVMTRILLERYSKRIPMDSLFAEENPEPQKPLAATDGVRAGAEIMLWHEHERPFMYGIDNICDSASDNAETFLHLAGHLVSQLETQLIRDVLKKLTAKEQHQLLLDRADKILRDRVFPEKTSVMRLARGIAKQCVERSLEKNAPLDDGANAFGILQTEFDEIATQHPRLARIIQFGFAYNIFTLIRDYGAKNKIWCLIELSGVMSIAHGLTIQRGGFCERHVEDLLQILEGE